MRTSLVSIGTLACLALSVYFGFASQQSHGMDGYGRPMDAVTNWGFVALTLVFGACGVVGLSHLVRKLG